MLSVVVEDVILLACKSIVGVFISNEFINVAFKLIIKQYSKIVSIDESSENKWLINHQIVDIALNNINVFIISGSQLNILKILIQKSRKIKTIMQL